MLYVHHLSATFLMWLYSQATYVLCTRVNKQVGMHIPN